MKENPKITIPFLIRTATPILMGSAVGMFLQGGIIDMPSDFPYSHGMWGALGVTVIFLYGIIIILATFLFEKRQNK